MSDIQFETVETPSVESSKPKLDLRRVLIDLGRRFWMVLIVAALAAAAGFLGGKRMSAQTFETQTTLVYRLNDEKKADMDANKNLLTLKEIVKVRSNLEEVRTGLGLNVSLQQLGSSLEVGVEKNTNLMTIAATWNTAEGAANLANKAREVFLKNQIDLDRIQAEREFQAGVRRRDVVAGELAKADLELQQFTNEHQVTDFVSMARSYLEGYNSADLLYQTAVVEQKTNEQQIRNLDRIVKEQKNKVAKEKNAAANMEDLTNLSTRMERLRTAIHDDQENRARQSDLALREIELENAKRLFAAGALAKRRVNEAQAAYDKQKALTVDTEQVRKWRDELENLQNTVLPSTAATPSTELLQEMLSKDFNLQLDSVAIESKVASFKAARDEYERKLSEMPDLQRTFVVLSRRADALDTEKKTLDENIAKAKRLLAIRTPDFITVSPAKEPALPKSSNRKTMTILLGGFTFFVGLAVVVGTVLLDPRLKTKGDLAAASQFPVLSELPPLGRKAEFPPKADSELAVTMSALSRAVRRTTPAKGARLAVAGIRSGDGASSFAASLATALARQGEKVALASFSHGSNAVSLVDPEVPVLDWISSINTVGGNLADVALECGPLRPHVLPMLPEGVNADSMTSLAMRSALDDASAAFDVVILDLDPASESLQLELVGSFCDGVLLVTRSGDMRREIVRRVEKGFEGVGVRVIGWILNAVPRIYQEPV